MKFMEIDANVRLRKLA